ncbi:hypothetical protein QA597_10555 [Marinilabiliaceae bacterium ANBcel2]|nr:hypothetical protein [Marinilabiliaceae bacterium ANBcel2]
MMIEGIQLNCKRVDVNNVLYQKEGVVLQNYVITSELTGLELISPSPIHGRSVITHFNNETNRFTITKGNGLTYFPYGYVNTQELDYNVWGYLNKTDAIRDYLSGTYINNLGIKTNIMEAVFSILPQKVNAFEKEQILEPFILQYSVLCPYRIYDLPFISKKTRDYYINQWRYLTEDNYSELHCIAADIMLGNIKIMHSDNVLHNAIHGQNYTLALELVDFELARTPITPYLREADEECYSVLFNREIIQTLEIVNYIAFFLHEKINIKILKKIFDKYGYESLYS